MANWITVVCLTGGPCAGKSMSLKVVKNALEARGFAVAVVPEVPTILFANGYSARTAKQEYEKVFYVHHMCTVQEVLEDAQISGVTMLAHRENKRGVILCDRGVTDNRAYVKPKIWEMVCAGKHYRDHGFSRYDAVVHLQSAAVGAEAFYEQNEVRNETTAEAAELDAKTLAAWQGHPNLTVVDNSTNFHAKILRVVDAVLKAVGTDSEKAKPVEKPALCGFDEAWVGTCKNPVPCSTHARVKCPCGAQAVRNCDATIGPFVCGAPTCARCTHSHY